MTLYTETNDHGETFLVSASGNQEFRLKLKQHERDELQRIAADLKEDD